MKAYREIKEKKLDIPLLSVGNIVAIDFLDHCSGDSAGTGPLKFTVWGRLSVVNDQWVTIQTWGYTDPKFTDGPEHDKFNIEQVVLVRGAILSVRQLVEKDSH